jgi:hypothetical protein
MTRRAVIVAVVLATGCDSVLGLRDFPPATVDGEVSVGCKTQPVALCADFEEDGPLVYTEMTPSVWSLSGTGVTATVEKPGHSGAGDLSIESAGGTFFKTFSPSAAATVVDASFDFHVARESTVPLETALMQIAFANSGHNSCYASFVIDESVPTLRVKGACGNADPHGEIAVPFGWVHVDVTFDLTGDVTATLTINNTTARATFSEPPLANLHYSIQIGIDTPALDGLSVGYDNIVVTSH